jgi:hypothetical protein
MGAPTRDDRACDLLRGNGMATRHQTEAAKKNIKKAANSAKRKRTLAHLPKKTRNALGKQANKVKRTRAQRAA